MTDRAPALGHHILELVDSLQPMPVAVQKLAEVVVQEFSNADDVAAIVREDPQLVTILLHEANSASSSPAREIDTVERAIVRLGLARVVATAALTTLRGDARRALNAYQMPAGALLEHSLRASYVAEASLGLRPDRISAASVTAALLHDIGKIVLDRVLDPESARDAMGRFVLIVDVERELISVDHAELGALILERWSVPSSIVDAVRYHHEPWRAESTGATVVALSDRLASYLASPDSEHRADGWTEIDQLLDRLELNRQKLIERSHLLLERAGLASVG